MVRSRPAKAAAEDKLRVVVSVLAGEMSCRKAARRLVSVRDSVVKCADVRLRLLVRRGVRGCRIAKTTKLLQISVSIKLATTIKGDLKCRSINATSPPDH
jgi:hypothetical protein